MDNYDKIHHVALVIGQVPYVGAVWEIGCGVATGSPGSVASGVVGLGIDLFSAGTGRVASNTARWIRAGGKGKSLVKAAKTAKNAKQIKDAKDGFGKLKDLKDIGSMVYKARNTRKAMQALGGWC